jgi:hypothetical protein
MKYAATIAYSAALFLFSCDASRSPPNTTSSIPVEARPQEPTARLASSANTPGSSSSSPGGAPVVATSPSSARTRTFDDETVDAQPTAFLFGRTGSGRVGKWVVRAEVGSPSGTNVLAQVDTDDTDGRFAIAVMNEPLLKDVRVSAQCKAVSGRVDQACGLVARYSDENNYLVTRANALEGNVRLYFVRAGQRHQLASWSGKVTANAWHEYRMDIVGDHIQVFWNGQPVIDHHDKTFTEAGRAGVWTKADSVTYFDDLRLEPL